MGSADKMSEEGVSVTVWKMDLNGVSLNTGPVEESNH